MARPVNLLRWREKRRRSLLRFWGLLFIGPWLIALAWLASNQAERAHRAQEQAWRQASDTEVYQALVQRERRLKEEQQRRTLWLAQEKAREATRRWQPRLLALAEQMPEQAWLTLIRWEGRSLSLSGLANRFQALTALDAAVRYLADSWMVSPGPVKRDAQGRWQFSYRIIAEADNAAPR